MSQYDFPTILPLTHNGTDLSNFLNAWEPALLSSHRGTSRPTYAVAGMVWIDTSVAGTETVTFYDGAHDVPLFSIDSVTGNITFTGGSVAGGITYKGEVDPTVTAPASPTQGDMYVIGNDGIADISFTGIAGDEVRENDVIFWDGTEYKYLVEQAPLEDYFPITGGTLEGDLSFSKPSILQPFTTIVPTSTYARLSEIADPNGGLDVEGFSGGAVGVRLLGHANSPSIVTNAGVFHFDARRGDGSGGDAPLAAADTAFSIFTDTVWLASVNGAGTQFLKGGVSTGGETAPDVDLGGLTLNQGAGDGNILTMKSTDVAHPFTATFEADTFYVNRKYDGVLGGFVSWALSSGSVAQQITGYAVTPNTTDSLQGVLNFEARKTNGTTGSTTLLAGENLATFSNQSLRRVTIKGSGDIRTQGGMATGGEAAPDVDLGGLCLNHGTSDGRVMTFKNSDVNHPFTAVAENDTYAQFQKSIAANGGLTIRSLMAGTTTYSLWLDGYCVTPSTQMLVAAQQGCIVLNARKTDGSTGGMSLTGAEKILSICNNSTIKIDINGAGSIYTTGLISTGAEAAPDVDLGGICINHGALDGYAFTIKNSDIAHPYTTVVETDTYFTIAKRDNLMGGASIQAMSEDRRALLLNGYCAANTTDMSLEGMLTFRAAITDAAGGVMAAGSTSNLFAFRNNASNIMSLRADGMQYNLSGLSTGGELLPDTDAGGLCLQQNALDGNILTMKSTDVAHPFTATAETDTYAQFGKRVANDGGLWIRGMSESTTSGITLTAKTQTAVALGTAAPLSFIVTKSNGSTGESTLANTESVLSVINGSTFVLQLLGSGSLFNLGGISTGGEVAPDVSAGGLCVQQNAATGVALSLKSTSVAHPFTTNAETDTYGYFARVDNTNGGVKLRGLASGTTSAVMIEALQQTGVTSGAGAFSISAYKSNGTTGVASISATENVLTVFNGATQIFTIKGNGDVIAAGSIGGGGSSASSISNGTSSVGIPVANDAIVATTAGAERLRIMAGGALATGGETAPDVDAGGLCLQQNALDFNILTLKSTDIAHGMTSVAETDTFFAVRKYHATQGGVFLAALSSGARGFSQYGLITTETLTYGAEAATTISGSLKSGTTIGPLSDAANMVSFLNNGTAKVVIKAGGSIYNTGLISTGGETAPDCAVGGLCLNQGATSADILTCKASAVNHPFTIFAENDTYARLTRVVTAGGLSLGGFATGATAFNVWAFATAPNTTGAGVVHFTAAKSNGTTGIADLAANENAFSVNNNSTALFTLKGNGAAAVAGPVSAGAGSNLPLGVNNQTGTTYTLALTDAGQNVTMNNASANTLTIPANASVAFPIGTTIKITQLGAGQTTVAITTDTLNVAATFQLKLAERYSEAVLTKLTATMWVLSGDLALV